MVTAQEVKGLVKPLLERHSDLTVVGRMVVLEPVDHLLRAVFVDRFSWKEAFRPWWLVNHTCDTPPHYDLSWGDVLHRTATGGWRTTRPQVQEELVERIESEALPRLRALDSLERYFDHVMGHEFRLRLLQHPARALIFQLAAGKLAEAKETCDGPIADRLRKGQFADDSVRASFEMAQKMWKLASAGKFANIAGQLHEFELATVRALKMEHLYERKPFPIERLAR